MRDLIATEMTFHGKKICACAFYDDMRLCGLRVTREKEPSVVSFVYRGTVDSVSANIGGAFVDIGGTLAFLPLAKHMHVQVSQPLMVQITKDASGVKAPVVTTNIHLDGRCCVVSSFPGKPSYSKKLTAEQRGIAEKWLGEAELDDENVQILVRTNFTKASKAEFLEEVRALAGTMKAVREKFGKASRGDVLYRPLPFYAMMYRDAYRKPDRCFSDIPAFAEELGKVSGLPADGILFTQGSRALSLAQLYGLPEDLEKLSSKRVWLKSGAYLVIEKTEAFVSIDVNTGKCSKGRIPEETYRKINLEAAEAVASQMFLRNLSGMILVDFISLDSEDHRNELLGTMRKLVKKDHIRTEAVDITPLGIMEIVRQKVRKPLDEELGL